MHVGRPGLVGPGFLASIDPARQAIAVVQGAPWPFPASARAHGTGAKIAVALRAGCATLKTVTSRIAGAPAVDSMLWQWIRGAHVQVRRVRVLALLGGGVWLHREGGARSGFSSHASLSSVR